MKTLILFLVAISLMIPGLGRAETLDEAVERQARQAEIDRKKIPVFAISVEALQSGRKFPGMPEAAIEAAHGIGGATTWVTVGKSEVKVQGHSGFVTFTIQPSAMSKPDANGATQHLWQPDPLEQLIGWVRGAQTQGIVFAKTQTDTSLAVPDYMTCTGLMSDRPLTDGLYEACKRFGLGDSDTFKVMKTAEDLASEREFLTYLMANYGMQGVLYRDALEQALGEHMARVRNLIQGSEEKTGYITYNPYSGTYQAATGHMLRADVHHSLIEPNGFVRVAVHVYSERVGRVEVELRYSDNSAVAMTAIGNAAKAIFTQEDLVAEESGGGFEIVEIKLPETLRPGKVQIVASAVDMKGELIVRGELIGSFDYVTGE